MIAISYRREDSLPIAGRLYDRLQAKFGKKNVFMDFDSIPPGMDFREQIRQMIEKANLVVAIIGPHWLGEQPDASRRIDSPVDFVRLEIAYALERGIPVIPLLINNTQMPKSEMLPPNIQELAFRQALPLDSGMDFHNHADRLIAGIGKATDAGRKQRRFIADSKETRPAKPTIDVPRASGDSEEPKRKQIPWTWSKLVVGTSVALLFAIAALAARYVATHRREPAKQVATANEPRSDKSVQPVSYSAPPEKPSVAIARSVQPSSPVPLASEQPKAIVEQSSQPQITKTPVPNNADTSPIPQLSIVKQTPQPQITKTPAPNNASTSPIPQLAGRDVKILSAPQPSYPPELETKRIGGSGRFEIDFDENGNAESTEIIQSTGQRLLDSNTVRVLMQWRASPGSRSKIIVPITYTPPKSRPRPAKAEAQPTASPLPQHPYGIPVKGRTGLVESPFSPGTYVPVKGFRHGTEVKDPSTGKIFLVP